MSSLGKYLSLLVIAIFIVSILLTVKPVNAQTIPKPAVPQFNVTLYDSSYDIPASATTNPYTGQQTNNPSTHITARTLVFTIQNQAFSSFQVKDSNNNVYNANLYYNLRFKGHFDPSQDWNVLFGPNFGYINPTSGPQTVYIANGSYTSQEFDVIQWSVGFPTDAQIDFQVEALIGYPSTPIIFSGQESGWSNTQTVAINQSVTMLPSTILQIYNSPISSTTATSTTSTPTPTSTVPEFSWLATLPLLLTIPIVLIAVKKRL